MFGTFVLGRVMRWFRVMHAALMRIFLLMMKPLRGSARRGGLSNDRRRKRQSQKQRCNRSREFHVRPPSRVLNKKLQWPMDIGALKLPLGQSQYFARIARIARRDLNRPAFGQNPDFARTKGTDGSR